MKRVLPLLAFLFLAVPLFALDDADRTARRSVVVDDVIRMAQAGVSDDAIISYVRNTRERFDVSADDIIAMHDAHVSRNVVEKVVDEAGVRNDRRSRDYRDDRRDRVERVYVEPGYYGYGYGYYPYWYAPYYDPFFYGPRFSIGFAFGPRFFGPRFHRRW